MNDDGRRSLPKIKCPYCGKRFGDFPSKELKNQSELVTKNYIEINKDIILQCPHCNKIVGLRIKNIEKVYSLSVKQFV